MFASSEITVRTILKDNKAKVAITWLLVALENVFMVLLPLFIGFAIDGLLTGALTALYWLAILLMLLTLVSVVRRFYDTRVYGNIRVEVGEAVDNQLRHPHPSPKNISVRNARINMSRELVDFLENDAPPLMTAATQLVASVVILGAFHLTLAISAVIAGIIMMLIYSWFHGYFVRMNGLLNSRLEQQVTILSLVPFRGIRRHLERIKRREILISDAEAILYGLIFLFLFGFVVANLWLSTLVPDPTAGQIFSVVTYSLEFVEAAVLLPITLQTLSRLTEISQRLNRQTEPEKQRAESK
nr:ABC transporter six-transmembrane domain-containing protein [uncultured Vibrio sp.]